MELFAGILILVGILVGALLFIKASFWIIACVVLPVFWLWMFVDAILRKEHEYPSHGINEKILWIVLMIVVPIAVIAYWFLVYKAPSRAVVPPPAAPAPPPAA